jgi:CheY-like chemotaxis protein
MHDRRNLVLILEDNPTRLALMREALDDSPEEYEIHHWDCVGKMQAEAVRLMPKVCLISLDFDLSNSTTRNPGDGMDAVAMLNQQKPVCPVIVHTSLAQTGQKMARALRGGGWTVERVMLDKREAVVDWRGAVERLTATSAVGSGADSKKRSAPPSPSP